PLLLAPFPACSGEWGRRVLSAATICGGIWILISAALARRRKVAPRFFSWTGMDAKTRACWVLTFLGGVGPWLMLMPLVNPFEVEMPRRFMWIWVALAAFVVGFAWQLLRTL